MFLFLNSWRSTVITGLTLPIALIGTFLFMYMFGFTINMITLMALSLCVGLLIDDAIVVRENIVRHVQMGKSAHDAALDGTNEIGLAVLATTLSIVAVFLPIGFMGGIIGKFFHEFGITIVAAVLISMFVSFTLDPMLSASGTTRIDGDGPGAPVTLYDKTIGRVTGWFDRHQRAGRAYQAILAGRWSHRLGHAGAGGASSPAAFFMVPLLGTEFVPKADFSGDHRQLLHPPVGSSLRSPRPSARQVDAILRELPEVRHTRHHHQHRQRPGQDLRQHLRAPGRPQGPPAQRGPDVRVPARAAARQVPGITVTHVGLLDPGRQQADPVLAAGPTRANWSWSACRRDHGQDPRIPGLVDLDSSVKPDKPDADRAPRDAASDLGLSACSHGRHPAHRWWPARRWATGARPTTRPTTSTCAWRPTPRTPPTT